MNNTGVSLRNKAGSVMGVTLSMLAAGPAWSWHDSASHYRSPDRGWALGVHTGRSVEESVHTGGSLCAV